MEEYKAYSYTRYKPKPRVFIFIIVPLVLVTAFFTANLIFGFVDFGALRANTSKSVTLQSITFHTTQTQGVTNKSEAMRTATEVKGQGGSAYLVAMDNAWQVIQEISNQPFDGSTEHVTTQVSINISDESHRELVETLIGTFKTTFDVLCDYHDKYKSGTMSMREITDITRIAYNNLIDVVGELELVQRDVRNPQYNDLLQALTAQLFGLNILWLETDSRNFSHTLKNAKSWTIFAYFDLTRTLQM
jgi:hypothetical protein